MRNIAFFLSVFILSSCSTANNTSIGAIANSEAQIDKLSEKQLSEKLLAFDKDFKSKSYESASRYCDEVIPYYVNNIAVLFRCAESQRLSGDLDSAIDSYEKALKLKKDSLPINEGRALAYISKGDFAKAQNILNILLSQDASRWRVINALGIISAMSGKIDEAIEYYDTALMMSNDNPVVVNNIALSYAFNGEYSKAIQTYRQLMMRLHGDSKKKEIVEQNLALVYGISGNLDMSKALLEKYLPEHSVYNNLGVYAMLGKDKKVAKSYLSKALSLSPVHYSKAWDNLQTVQ